MGKTLVAQKLMERYNIPYTSLDHLKMGFIRTGMTKLTVNDDYEMRYFLWPYAAEMIKTAIENNQNMIMEGCYIPKEWKESFDKEYLQHIKCVFITMSEDYIRNHFEDLSKYASVIEKRVDDELDMDRLIMCSKNFQNDCSQNNTKCINIEKEYDLDGIIEEIDRYVNDRYICPCCGNYTFTEEPGSFDICPVCYWEDDAVQNDNEDLSGGANKVSLREARENYKKFGACEERFISNVRKPYSEEMKDEH